jgi:CelD/BcsL family acetyltransferase involved in cellulose biosynthesis
MLASMVLPSPNPESRIPDPVSIDVIDDYAAFLALEGEWNDAVARAGITHPFLRHEWIRTWWDAFATPGARLHILVVRSSGRIIAIAPLMRETTQMYGLPARRVRFIHNDHTPRTDIIVAEQPDQAYPAIWDTLQADRNPWDVLQLSQVMRESDTLRVFSTLAARDRCTTGVWKSTESPYLTLTDTWDDYVNRLPAKFRSNLRNRLSRLTRLGEPTLEVLSERGAIEAAGDEAWRLESSGWKREAGTAITCDPAVHRFYTTLIARGTAAGWLRLLFLTAGGIRVATSYGACVGGALFLFKTGYDPEYAPCSPFKLLTYYAIQDAYAQGLTEVDFLGDTEPWKREWTTTARGHDWLFVFADSIRARLLHSIKFQWGPELKRWRA